MDNREEINRKMLNLGIVSIDGHSDFTYSDLRDDEEWLEEFDHGRIKERVNELADAILSSNPSLDRRVVKRAFLQEFAKSDERIYAGLKANFFKELMEQSRELEMDQKGNFELLKQQIEKTRSEILEIATLGPDTPENIIISSPSVRLLRDIQRDKISLEDLKWREFEELIAERLHQAGFSVRPIAKIFCRKVEL